MHADPEILRLKEEIFLLREHGEGKAKSDAEELLYGV